MNSYLIKYLINFVQIDQNLLLHINTMLAYNSVLTVLIICKILSCLVHAHIRLCDVHTQVLPHTLICVFALPHTQVHKLCEYTWKLPSITVRFVCDNLPNLKRYVEKYLE